MGFFTTQMVINFVGGVGFIGLISLFGKLAEGKNS